MLVNSITSQPFNGLISLYKKSNNTVYTLDTDKILKIQARENRTRIYYDIPVEHKHNGYTYKEPSSLEFDYNIDTVLKAYSAAKNSNVKIDLSEISNV